MAHETDLDTLRHSCSSTKRRAENRKCVVGTAAALVLLVGMLCTRAYSQEENSAKSQKGVIFKTDKEQYRVKENIVLEVVNNLEVGIFSHATSAPEFFIERIERKNADGSWQKMDVRCRWPECDIDFDGPSELKSGEPTRFIWRPRMHVNKQDRVAGPGVYRLVGQYQIRQDRPDSKDWQWQEVYTGEFTIE